ncbi:MAG: hypothetical protein ACI4P7_00895 [Bacilli bacterium]
MLQVISLIRKLHPNTVIIVDDYDYYYLYARDIYIVYYLLGFSVKKYKGNLFMKDNIQYLNYLISKLRQVHINYLVVVKRWGYNVDIREDFLDNSYLKYFQKGKLVFKRKKQIDGIYSKLQKNILGNKNKIMKIKEFIDSYV